MQTKETPPTRSRLPVTVFSGFLGAYGDRLGAKAEVRNLDFAIVSVACGFNGKPQSPGFWTDQTPW